jgi:dGTP triphosphohydrolase
MAEPERIGETFGPETTEQDTARRVADYIAGMTDRFALRECDRWS